MVALKEVKWRAVKEVCWLSNKKKIRVVILRDVARKEMWWLSKQCGGSQPVTCRKTNHRQHNYRIFPKDRLVLAGPLTSLQQSNKALYGSLVPPRQEVCG